MNKTGSLSFEDKVEVGGDALIFRVTSEQSDGALTGAFYIANDDGEVERTVAGPGAVVPIGGAREHTIRNESREEARAFVVFSPGTEMEQFARAAGALAQRGTPGVDEVLALAEAHGIEMTRPLNGDR